MATINNPDILNNDVIIRRSLKVEGGLDLALQIENADISTTAGIVSTKLQHRFSPGYNQPNTTATSVTQPIYVARGAGTILTFRAWSIAIAVGAATVTVDLKKNGTTCLAAVITLDSANTARVAESGTLSVTTYAAGDTFEIVTVATAGGGTIPTGFACQMDVDEAAA